MKLIYVLIYLSFNCAAFSQSDNPFLSLKFDKMIMCDFEGSGEKRGSVVEENGLLTSKITKQVQLSTSIVIALNNKLAYVNRLVRQRHFAMTLILDLSTI
jgi:hypothetical protein